MSAGQQGLASCAVILSQHLLPVFLVYQTAESFCFWRYHSDACVIALWIEAGARVSFASLLRGLGDLAAPARWSG